MLASELQHRIVLSRVISGAIISIAIFVVAIIIAAMIRSSSHGFLEIIDDKPVSQGIRRLELQMESERVSFVDDPYSDRIRCDHPKTRNPRALGQTLFRLAHARRRGRIVVLSDFRFAKTLMIQGFKIEGIMPGFYQGRQDCAVLGAYPDASRQSLTNSLQTNEVLELVRNKPKKTNRKGAETRKAEIQDADSIANLLAFTFSQYPTPSGEPSYIRSMIEDGIPFRVVEIDGRVVACASADLVREAKTAELTDCASLPECRGKGFMQAILDDLMEDLRELGYPTAFTLARSSVAGVNVAFHRLGFEWRGTMPQSCRIGEGIEDMNIWSRYL